MTDLLSDPRIDWDLLRRYDFDRERFGATAERIARGELTEGSSVIRDPIAAISDILDVTWSGSAADAAREAGESALRNGHVAVAVLNGGMATRFGGVVKGVVQVTEGESFLALKAQDVLEAQVRYGARIPFVVMNSFSTDDATRSHLEAKNYFGLDEDDVFLFHQSIALRLEQNGSLFITSTGLPGYYAPGHGDFFPMIRKKALLGHLLERGIRIVVLSNVDNLAATLDPVILGHHILASSQMTIEVTAKQRSPNGEWERGGSPAVVNQIAQIVEGFRLPAHLVGSLLPDFSTNTFWFDAHALDRAIVLPWHVVTKTVEGRCALQLESIACEASGLVDRQGEKLFRAHFVRVPRGGDHGRFWPVKEPADLGLVREMMLAKKAKRPVPDRV